VDSRISRASRQFSFALLTIIVWAGTGPLFDYSDTWQLVINTGTTIVTFLGIPNPENPESRHSSNTPKAGDLIRATQGARNMMLDLEHLDDESLKRLRDI
jgi:low affinity Fe/Cu permease